MRYSIATAVPVVVVLVAGRGWCAAVMRRPGRAPVRPDLPCARPGPKYMLDMTFPLIHPTSRRRPTTSRKTAIWSPTSRRGPRCETFSLTKRTPPANSTARAVPPQATRSVAQILPGPGGAHPSPVKAQLQPRDPQPITFDTRCSCPAPRHWTASTHRSASRHVHRLFGADIAFDRPRPGSLPELCYHRRRPIFYFAQVSCCRRLSALPGAAQRHSAAGTHKK